MASTTRRVLISTAAILAAGDAFAQQRPAQQAQPAPRAAAPPASQPTAEELSRGPFGLTWGSSAEEVRNQEVQLTASPSSDFGRSFTATGLSQVLSDAAVVFLSFGHRNRLWRVAAAGNANTNDPFGGATVARYRELAQALTSRYGSGREIDTRDSRIWKEAHEYVMSLRTGRASRFTTFNTPVVSVELSVRATSGDSSHWFLIFESKAEQALFEEDKRRRERDSL